MLQEWTFLNRINPITTASNTIISLNEGKVTNSEQMSCKSQHGLDSDTCPVLSYSPTGDQMALRRRRLRCDHQKNVNLENAGLNWRSSGGVLDVITTQRRPCERVSGAAAASETSYIRSADLLRPYIDHSHHHKGWIFFWTDRKFTYGRWRR